MTQREAALAGRITPAMEQAAQAEGLAPEVIREGLARGTLVVPANPGHRGLKPWPSAPASGSRSTPISAPPPTTSIWKRSRPSWPRPWSMGRDAVMDLSTGGDLDDIRTALLARCPAPFGTVPIYQVMTEAHSLDEVKGDDLLEMVRHHARQGVDFVTVHCGVTRAALPLLKKRVTGVVSRGGAFLTAWMRRFGRENPLYEKYDRSWTSPRNMTSPCPWGTACAPAVWPTPPIGPSCTS